MKLGLTIGAVASELHLNPKTIRYYEEVGLLPKPQRNESGYRMYSRKEIERLQLVKRAKLLGLSLAEIKKIVEYAIDGRCNVVEQQLSQLVKTKLSEIDQKIDDLAAFRDDLRRYHSDLSQRLKTEIPKENREPATVSCQCIGEEVESFQR